MPLINANGEGIICDEYGLFAVTTGNAINCVCQALLSTIADRSDPSKPVITICVNPNFRGFS